MAVMVQALRWAVVVGLLVMLLPVAAAEIVVESVALCVRPHRHPRSVRR